MDRENVAGGEMALEEELKECRLYWKNKKGVVEILTLHSDLNLATVAGPVESGIHPDSDSSQYWLSRAQFSE